MHAKTQQEEFIFHFFVINGRSYLHKIFRICRAGSHKIKF